MGQAINKVGEITVSSIKNVVFTNRIIKDLVVTEGENAVIRYVNQSDEGNEEQVAIVPFDRFNEKAESMLWEVIDESLDNPVVF